jgi:hypothetical protein
MGELWTTLPQPPKWVMSGITVVPPRPKPGALYGRMAGRVSRRFGVCGGGAGRNNPRFLSRGVGPSPCQTAPRDLDRKIDQEGVRTRFRIRNHCSSCRSRIGHRRTARHRTNRRPNHSRSPHRRHRIQHSYGSMASRECFLHIVPTPLNPHARLRPTLRRLHFASRRGLRL